MKALKNLFVAATLLALMAVPAAAGVHSAAGLSSGPHPHPADAGLVFELDNTMPLELAELSRQEMIETEGELAPLVVLAILGSSAASAWTYHGVNYLKHGELGSSQGAAFSAGAGALAATKGTAIVAGYGLRGTTAGILRVHTFKVDTALQMANPW